MYVEGLSNIQHTRLTTPTRAWGVVKDDISTIMMGSTTWFAVASEADKIGRQGLFIDD